MGAATANTTTSYPIMNVTRPIKITKIAVSSITVPIDADGTLLLNIFAHDDSESDEDLLISAADWDMETNITDESEAYTIALTATAADLLLVDKDSIYATITSNSAAIGTNVNGSFYIEYEIL